MILLRASDEARQLGRLLYTISAITIGASYGVTIELTDPISVHLPGRIPLVGVLGLLLAYILLYLLVRVIDETASYAYDRAYMRHMALQKPRITVAEVTSYKADLGHVGIRQIVSRAPTVQKTAVTLIFVLDVVLPMLAAVLAIYYSYPSVITLLFAVRH